MTFQQPDTRPGDALMCLKMSGVRELFTLASSTLSQEEKGSQMVGVCKRKNSLNLLLFTWLYAVNIR